MDYFDMSGKVVLVTGSSRGLGYEMVKAFAAQGAEVIVTSRKVEDCRTVTAEVERLGGRALAQACHVGRWSDIEALVGTAYETFGRVDVLVNNAGIAPAMPSSLQMSEELIDKTFAVNFKGPFRLCALIGSRMAAGAGGSIINVTSTGAIRPQPQFGPYAAAKAALNVVTRSFAHEYGPKVRVNAIMCGPFWTDIAKSWREDVDKSIDSAARRIGRPEEIVTTALYLASRHSSYTTGTVIELSGGIR